MIRVQDGLYQRSRERTLDSLVQWLPLVLMAALLTGVACRKR